MFNLTAVYWVIMIATFVSLFIKGDSTTNILLIGIFYCVFRIANRLIEKK